MFRVAPEGATLRSSKKRKSMRPVVLVILLAGLACGPALAADEEDQPAAAVVRTGKERLGDKGSDEQRVDDCTVPPARRSRARPMECHFR